MKNMLDSFNRELDFADKMITECEDTICYYLRLIYATKWKRTCFYSYCFNMPSIIEIQKYFIFSHFTLSYSDHRL